MVFADQKQYITSQWNLSITVRNFVKINLKNVPFPETMKGQISSMVIGGNIKK